MSKPPILARIGSRLVGSYLESSPIERGKTRLLRATAFFLVARLDTGPWVRVSGVSDFEWQILGRRFKEAGTIRLFAELLRPGMTVVDLGANIGYFTLTAADLVGPKGHVHAIEPTPSTASRLRENVALNGFDQVSIHQIAASDDEGTLRLHLSEDDCEGNSLFAAEPGGNSIEVDVTTLDHFADQQGLRRIDLLKVDVEGAEVRVLRGARRVLSGTVAPVLIVEANSPALRAAKSHPTELYDLLDTLGYSWRVVERMPWQGEVVLNLVAFKPYHGSSLRRLADSWARQAAAEPPSKCPLEGIS
ncbi:FkbM family methyltransferase [Paludisphaera rhizosphaerae]|uniref:FkbM family methyltransferase n=1 Tax=Paludisphaera rhizosphaerae TaxID=2711216 RepID=UPI0013E9E975|nr:FkbM family methyltransferase [Paludisphaera rhizosphaerae]